MRLLFLPVVFSLAAAGAAEDLLAVAKAHQAGFRKAMLARDMKWFERTAGPDFYETDLKGKRMDRAQALTEIREAFRMGKPTRVDAKVVKTERTKAGMRETVDIRMTISMLAPGAKKPSVMDSRVRYLESWSRHGAAWTIDSIKPLSEKSTIDGKPFTGGM